MYFTVLLLLEGSEVEGPLASSLGLLPPLENCLRRSRGIVRHCFSAATGSSERRTRHGRAETRDEKTLRLKVQCPIFALIYDFCVGETYYIARKIH